ncbi:hypothetical protein ACLMJK_005770 [Lecanora helva]
MFVKPRQKRSLLPPTKKRKFNPAIEEITFDPSAREDYLTGFHKRKLQRIKHAQGEATKREREEKIAARKSLRESRKADLDKHVQAVNSMLREQNNVVLDASEEDTTNPAESWEGIAEETVDYEDEYVDEDRFTTVTVEAVDVSKDGLHKAKQEEEEESDRTSMDRPPEGSREALSKQKAEDRSVKREEKEPLKKPKKKKKKFHYEGKAERKITRLKEKSRNRAKSKARSGNA